MPVVAVANADAYSINVLDDSTYVTAFDVDSGTAGVTTKTDLPGADIIHSALVSRGGSAPVLAYSLRNAATGFVKLNDTASTTSPLACNLDTGLAASRGGEVAYLKPATQAGHASLALCVPGGGAADRQIELKFTPTHLVATDGGYAAVGWSAGVLTAQLFDPKLTSVGMRTTPAGEPIAVTWDAGLVVLVQGKVTRSPDGQAPFPLEIRPAGPKSSVGSIAGDYVAYNDSGSEGPVIVVKSMASGAKRVYPESTSESLLALRVTRKGNMAALYPTSVTFGDTNGKSRQLPLVGDTSTSW